MERLMMETLGITQREDKNGNLRDLDLNLRCDLAYIRRAFKREIAKKQYNNCRLINNDGLKMQVLLFPTDTHEGRQRIIEIIKEIIETYNIIKMEFI